MACKIVSDSPNASILAFVMSKLEMELLPFENNRHTLGANEEEKLKTGF